MSILTSGLSLYDIGAGTTGSYGAMTFSGGSLYVNGVIVTGAGSTGTYATTFNLGLTGSVLYGYISTLSGYDAATYGTAASLQTTGQTLYALATGLSGQSVSTYATLTNVTVTGQSLYNDVVGLSGQANTALASTGSTLYKDVTGLSGQANGTYATIANLAATGQALYGDIVGLSGVLQAFYTAYASGSYNLATGTNAISLTSGSSSVVLTSPGTYLVQPRVNVFANLATAGGQFVTVQLYQQGGAAVPGTQTVMDLPSISTATQTLFINTLSPAVFATSATGATLQLYGGLTSLPALGSIQIVEASIVATRLF